ncbi:MAG: hypothetical protein EXR68_00495 [Dehalococcoidia bacterium]|nr:hypothetical protein [Dehalococcoidia bacterium]
MATATPTRALNVFFDVDFTLIDGDGRLRNHTHEVMEALHADGHAIYVWSGNGIRQWEMEKHDLHHLVTGYYVKPLHSYRESLRMFYIRVVPDYAIDDHLGVVEAFGGYHIPADMPKDDDHLLRVLEEIRALAAEPVAPAD